MPEISVIVPVYNTEQYLHRCIDSILAQTFTDFELILVDDGSTDESGKICDEYANHDKRVCVFHQKNQGQAAARNNAIKHSKGEYISFVDSDDILHFQFLESLYSQIKQGAEIAICRAVEGAEIPNGFFEKKEVVFKQLTPDENTILMLHQVPLICWTVWGRLIKREIVTENMFNQGRYYEDTVTIVWLFAANKIAISDEVLYFYRNNPTGTMNSPVSTKKALDGIWSVRFRLEYARIHQLYRIERLYESRFLYESAKAFFLIQKMDKVLAKDIKRKAFFEWKKNKNSVDYKSKEEKLLIYEMFFPKAIWLYWQVNRLKK